MTARRHLLLLEGANALQGSALPRPDAPSHTKFARAEQAFFPLRAVSLFLLVSSRSFYERRETKRALGSLGACKL